MGASIVWALAALSGCGQGDYNFTTQPDVDNPIIDTQTDSDPIVWDDCGITAAEATVVPTDSSCLDGGSPAADLKAKITDVCFPGCEEGAPVFVAVQVTNQGGAAVTADVPVTVYAGTAAGAWHPVMATWTLEGGLEPGEVATGKVLEFDVLALEGEPIRLAANDDGTGAGTVDECDTRNNGDLWDAVPCGQE